MAITTTAYDPTTTAQALAQTYTSGRQSTLDTQTKNATATEKALSTLSTALSTFQTSLAAMTSSTKAMAANSASFSDTGVASATAKSNAVAGTYSFFVEQLASAHQVSYTGLGDYAAGGKLDIGVGSNAFSIDLTGKTWSARELAAAINGATNNTSVSASVVTTGATSELVLTAKLTGDDNQIKLTFGDAVVDPDADPDAPVVASPLSTWLGSANQLTKGQNAVIHVGSESGSRISQASNTFNIIDGVSMTVSKAQSSGSTPVTLTVAADASKTLTNVQAFVDAYNRLKTSLDTLTSPGDASKGTAGGAFANDSGVRALSERLISALRSNANGTLVSYGITASRTGALTLDSSRLAKALEKNPTGLDTLMGSASTTAPSGIAGQLDTYLKMWTSSNGGQITTRKAAVTSLQSRLITRQSELDKQYDSAYARYLAQFTKLQTLQSTMTYNSSLFDSLFSSSKDN